MRHLSKGKKFGRKKGQRNAFFKSLAGNLILNGRIETTEIRAKEIKPFVEKLVSIARKQKLADLRLLLSRLPKKAAEKAFYEIGPRYQNRSGGYLRIMKGGKVRKSDSAKMAIIEFV